MKESSNLLIIFWHLLDWAHPTNGGVFLSPKRALYISFPGVSYLEMHGCAFPRGCFGNLVYIINCSRINQIILTYPAEFFFRGF
jgi:hypothetical protein